MRAQAPEWRCCCAHLRGCRELTPCFAREHLLPLGSQKLLHKREIQARGHDKAFMTDHKSFSTQYLDFQRGFYPLYQSVPAPGAPPDSKKFLCRVNQASNLYRKVTETNAFVQKEFHFKYLAFCMPTLVKSSWPPLIYIENFIEYFFAFGLCFILSLVHIDLYNTKLKEATIQLEASTCE